MSQSNTQVEGTPRSARSALLLVLLIGAMGFGWVARDLAALGSPPPSGIADWRVQQRTSTAVDLMKDLESELRGILSSWKAHVDADGRWQFASANEPLPMNVQGDIVTPGLRQQIEAVLSRYRQRADVLNLLVFVYGRYSDVSPHEAAQEKRDMPVIRAGLRIGPWIGGMTVHVAEVLYDEQPILVEAGNFGPLLPGTNPFTEKPEMDVVTRVWDEVVDRSHAGPHPGSFIRASRRWAEAGGFMCEVRAAILP